ncbi:pentapeptide repeat-containing protein [Streptomyces sp. NPDC001139]
MSTALPPTWPHCGYGADPASDPIGCSGIEVPGHTACLAHLTDTARTAYLTSLTPGADIDHRGTPFTQDLLQALLRALTDPTTNTPHLGAARFDGARIVEAQFHGVQFTGETRFVGTHFSGRSFSPAHFDDARFTGEAHFSDARFTGEAHFGRVQFASSANFHGAQFDCKAEFFDAQFDGYATFGPTRFMSEVSFRRAYFGKAAWFANVQFGGDSWFNSATFSEDARFDKAQFSRTVNFEEVQFSGPAGFTEAQFASNASFLGTRFAGPVGFSGTRFTGNAWFIGAQFSGPAGFDRPGIRSLTEAPFFGPAGFEGAQFMVDARFDRAHFESVSVFGPLACGRRVVLSGAVFVSPVTLEIAAEEVACVRTRWESTAVVRLRYADLDLSQAVLTAPTAVVVHPTPFIYHPDPTSPGQRVTDRPLSETLMTGTDPRAPRRLPDRVRALSVQGVDAAHLVLTDTDLTKCLFSGAFHLDQMRLEGRTTFADPPTGWHRRRIWPVRYTRRRVLAEEHHWRSHTLGAGFGWHRPEPRTPFPTPDPVDVAALYRQLRKALEDGKNEPGAADFYYGESEMRRHDPTGTTKSERRLLWGYWLLSGYGLRASRAFAWLLAAMSVTVLLLMGVGLPTHDPDPATTGTVHGSKINLHTSTPGPALHGGWPQRMTWARAEKATRVAVNSVVFRSSGQNLTTAGTYIEMASRLLEPTLLALGVLAIRGRIKR